ncbi:tetratricopeptide repeat protein [Geobacter sp. DSM 9736]|uniref:tetratricopeptide repeat protein n=1 Tax=Geobacter sp. DSM 9736 TaxID=1277350 RepID=UPI000B512189|nr:tetratricopeptide repeat protein [Geobacter sp. DSM 9736]SNB47464.1 Tetratricopeptide repeat-containing protein [Geobacter sp. DSM 9736]
MGTGRSFFLPASLLVALFMPALLPLPASAHPESGFLPDAIAETEYKIVLDLNPRDNVTRNKLGVVLYRKNKLKEAERCFGDVLRAEPRNFDAHDGMGLVRIKERKYEEAVSWFRKAIGIAPDDTMVHYNMGFAFEQMGKLKEAEAAYRRSLEVNAGLIRKGMNREVEAGKRAILVSALTSLNNRMKQTR